MISLHVEPSRSLPDYDTYTVTSDHGTAWVAVNKYTTPRDGSYVIKNDTSADYTAVMSAILDYRSKYFT